MMTRSDSSRRRSPVVTLLAALVFGAPVCVPSPDPLPLEPESDPPETVLLPSCDPDEEARFCWRGSDPDGHVSGYQHQLLLIDEEYYETAGESGALIRWLNPESEDRWSLKDPRTSIKFVIGPGSYLLRVRALDDDGNPDPTPAETLWQWDPYSPVVTIRSGCGLLYPDPTRLVIRCDAVDVGADRVPTPRTELVYSYLFYLSYGTGDCPRFWSGETEWEPFPDEETPVEIVFEDLDGPAPPSAPSGDVECEWFFCFTVRDPAGNLEGASCKIVILP